MACEPILSRTHNNAENHVPSERLKRQGLMAAVVSVMLFGFDNAFSQVFGTSSHTVTVIVAEINNIQLTLGSVDLTITGSEAIAGQDQMTVTDQSSSLLWGLNSSQKKITVQTNLASQLFSLKVEALTPTQGTAAPEATLSTTAADILLNIGRSSGSCLLKYTGIALASQGTGTDAHTVTFTVQAQ